MYTTRILSRIAAMTGLLLFGLIVAEPGVSDLLPSGVALSFLACFLFYQGLASGEAGPKGAYLAAGAGVLLVAFVWGVPSLWASLPTGMQLVVVGVALSLLYFMGASFRGGLEKVRQAIAQEAQSRASSLVRGKLGNEAAIKFVAPFSPQEFGLEAWFTLVIPLFAVVVTALLLWWTPAAGVSPPRVLSILVVLVAGAIAWLFVREACQHPLNSQAMSRARWAISHERDGAISDVVFETVKSKNARAAAKASSAQPPVSPSSATTKKPKKVGAPPDSVKKSRIRRSKKSG